MNVFPYFIGSGRAARAIEEALAVLATSYEGAARESEAAPRVTMQPATYFKRGETPKKHSENGVHLLLIANPHGLHAESILKGAEAGFDAIGCEKPSCVSVEEIDRLSGVKTPTAIFHVYRMMWGPQEIKRRLDAREFGEIASIEGRYWQSSSAESALFDPHAKSWKNDTRLGGHFDALIDVGTHWIDLATYLAGDSITSANIWRSFVNSPAAHRDTHVQVTLDFANHLRAMGSISKTMHGASNHFEVNVIGQKQSATWNFLRPDELSIGKGRDLTIYSMRKNELGARHPPHHSMGWTEGYVEILRRLIDQTTGKGGGIGIDTSPYPTLAENLKLMRTILNAAV